MNIENIYPINVGTLLASNEDVASIDIQYREYAGAIFNILEPTWGDTALSSFSSSKDFLHEYNQTSLSIFITNSVGEFYQRNIGWDINFNDSVMRESWVNVSQKYGYQERHNHVAKRTFRVGISGVYYIQTNGHDGNLEFFPPDLYEGHYPATYTVQPEVGKLVLFRSELYHRVRANLTENDRISVSFNYFFS